MPRTSENVECISSPKRQYKQVDKIYFKVNVNITENVPNFVGTSTYKHMMYSLFVMQ